MSVNTGRTDAVSVTEVVPQLAEACNLPFLEIVKAPEKESSGSLLMATDIDKLNELRNSWQIAGVNHSIIRKFLAVTIGIPEPEAGTICQALKNVSIGDHLLTVPVRNVSLKSIKSGHAKKATTEYRVLSKNEDLNCALLEIQVDKLRHHQLQVHLGQKMCKILGDHLYSSRVRCILGTDVTANPLEVTPRTQVSTMKCGLLPISQEALICGEISYYDYTGIVVEEEQNDQIIRALGPKNKILFLRNHGIVCCGGSIEEAYFLALNCVAACEIQIRAVVEGLDNVIHLLDEVRDKVREATAKGEGGVSETGHKLKVGELELEAMMRHLDNMCYRTGYVYRQPFVRHELKPKSDVAQYPAASTNFTYIYDNKFEKSK
ncbi:gamma-adducin-like isoform X2 [Apostichopus japonicus]